MPVDIKERNMAYKLQKPFSKTERLNFIIQYNHNLGLKIEETEAALYALDTNEVMQNGVPIVDSDYENKQFLIQTEQKIQELSEELGKLDIKRIRAICEPEIRSEETGETWIDYYNAEIQKLRQQIQELKERTKQNDITK